MGLSNWISAIRKRTAAASATHGSGAALRVHAVTRIEAFATSRLDETARELLATFRARLDTVEDETAHDPELIASVEFNIFKRRLRAARHEMAAELLDHIHAEMVAADRYNMAPDLLVLVDTTVDDRLDTLAFGASALYDFKIEEIRERHSEDATLPNQARKTV